MTTHRCLEEPEAMKNTEGLRLRHLQGMQRGRDLRVVTDEAAVLMRQRQRVERGELQPRAQSGP